ncbi:carbohydrate esterase family 1 protein [Ceratobasidium sp. AG-Ba]|nr:carbohydrate esterase family 1 protein [Ceratobasidium sp. AG-Ba]
MRSIVVALASIGALAHQVAAVSVWGQCGGVRYSGSTMCDSGTSCVNVTESYHQCQPGSDSGASTPTRRANIPKGTLAPISNFGTNPTGVKLYVYVPTSVKSNPAMLVALHYCGGSAQALYTGTSFKQYADQYGFVVMYPGTSDSSGCWDVYSSATFKHNGGGDSLGIASGIRYLTTALNVNPARVVAAGLSSGAMMTNVMAGAYPDLIKAGSVHMGVAYGCFAGSGFWNSQCATGQLIKTPSSGATLFAVARDGGHDAVPAEPPGGDQAVDERVRSEPDADVDDAELPALGLDQDGLRIERASHPRDGREPQHARAVPADHCLAGTEPVEPGVARRLVVKLDEASKTNAARFTGYMRTSLVYPQRDIPTKSHSAGQPGR